ncbi:MAG: VWA domain-containing protein [Candidatus Bathyarchaeota archaeon]|nr:MAG: VWA domain-containing protein [Candidatus Bathyarchaeota archaeon]
MGFLEYANETSFEKDPLKLKFLLVEDSRYSKLYEDDHGFTAHLPLPVFGEESISLFGFEFPESSDGRQMVARLFRVAVYHLSSHSAASSYEEYKAWALGKNEVLSRFVISLLEDIGVKSHIVKWYPERLTDLACVCSLALKRMRRIENIRIEATRLMASLMIYANTGVRRFTSPADRDVIEPLYGEIDRFKAVILKSIADESMDIRDEKLKAADPIYENIMERGPIIEAPSLPYTENIGPNSLFPPKKVGPHVKLDALMAECLDGMGVAQVQEDQLSWRGAAEAEALQVFDSHFLEKEKEKKILSRYEEYAFFSRFNSIGFPRKDYTEFLRAKARCKKSTSKMTEMLLVALNAYMEDIRKLHGVLDLADAIQVIASKSDRSDVFLLDEKIQKSFAWAILIDASTSMRQIRDYTLEMSVVLAETASKILLDTTSLSVFAFNDRFEIIKDFNEPYNTRVKSRLGGLEFKGLTYLPDAMEIAGRALGGRNEELKILVVISDGWPYGYSNIYPAATETLRELEAADMVVIGVGAQSGRMEFIFDTHCTSFTLSEFVNKFGDRYIDACQNIG